MKKLRHYFVKTFDGDKNNVHLSLPALGNPRFVMNRSRFRTSTCKVAAGFNQRFDDTDVELTQPSFYVMTKLSASRRQLQTAAPLLKSRSFIDQLANNAVQTESSSSSTNRHHCSCRVQTPGHLLGSGLTSYFYLSSPLSLPSLLSFFCGGSGGQGRGKRVWFEIFKSDDLF